MSKLWVENNEQIPAVAYQDVSPTGNYSDESASLTSWDSYWSKLVETDQRDYLFCKDKMKSIVDAAGGFSQLTDPEKWIAFEHEIGDIDDWMSIPGVTNDIIVQFNLRYKDRMMGCLGVRMAYAESILKANFHLNDLHSMVGIIQPELLNFVVLGIIGRPEHNIDGIKDYLNSTNKFSGSGFLQETWAIKSGLTRTQIRDAVYAALIDGVY